ncbi:MAG: 3-hydroxyacyl-CoA dehydrogenase family protein [Deltaproteobacteria bacterium]|nr:3-hydroxyacyl-CoA dehydrogenase family protein [Deltaproteobacteria bacterium]
MKPANESVAAVIGLGTMGPGLAQILAQGGYRVVGYDRNAAAVEACRRMIPAICRTLEEHGVIDPEETRGILGRISYAPSIADQVADADIVIEAVSEDRDVKRSVFEAIDTAAPEACMLWSNTSTLNVFELMPAQRHPAAVIAHWFAPPHIVPLVEVVKGEATRPDIVARTLDILHSLGKRPIVIERYVPGFIINRILRIIGREAFFLLDNGYISAEDLDLAVKASIAPRMMVLGLIQRYDFTGLDLSARNLLDESFFDPPVDNRPKALHRHIEKGHLGVKSGKGFFDYGDRDPSEICRERDRLLLKVIDNLRFCLEKKRLV